jgi:hypothetical protein
VVKQMWNEEEDAQYNNAATAAWQAVKHTAEQARLAVKKEAEADDDDDGDGVAAAARCSKRGQPFCQVCCAASALRCNAVDAYTRLRSRLAFPANAVGRRVATPNLHAHRG